MVHVLHRSAAILLGLSILLTALPANASNDTSRLDRIRRRAQQHTTQTPKAAPKSQPKPVTNQPSRRNLGQQTPKQPKPSVDRQTTKAPSIDPSELYTYMAGVLKTMRAAKTQDISYIIGQDKADRVDEISRSYANYLNEVGALQQKAQQVPLADYDLTTLAQIQTNADVFRTEFNAIIDEFNAQLDLIHGIKH